MHVGITSQRVRDVYAKAFDSARQRLGKSDFELSDINESTSPAERAGETSAAIPLEGLPAELHARVRMLEALAWSEHLVLYHQQRAVALKLILQQWVKNPFSLQPPRVLLRRFMPDKVVSRIVRMKNGPHPKLNEMPGRP
jgi:hypothetical protein